MTRLSLQEAELLKGEPYEMLIFGWNKNKVLALSFSTAQWSLSDICNLRLDFESFTLAGPSVTTETAGGACTDTLVITVGSLLQCLKN